MFQVMTPNGLMLLAVYGIDGAPAYSSPIVVAYLCQILQHILEVLEKCLKDRMLLR